MLKRVLFGLLATMYIVTVFADVETVDGFVWNFNVICDEVMITHGDYSGDIIIPDRLADKKVTCIGDSAFEDCTNLTSVVFCSGITNIGSRAFSCCCRLSAVDIPSSVKRIGNGAFYGCTILNDVCLNEGLEELGCLGTNVVERKYGAEIFYDQYGVITGTVSKMAVVYNVHSNAACVHEELVKKNAGGVIIGTEKLGQVLCIIRNCVLCNCLRSWVT